MSETRATRLGNDVRGPVRGLVFRSNTSSTQVAIDLTAYINREVAVTVYGEPTGLQMAPGTNTTTYAISLTATSGNSQCHEVGVGGTMAFFVQAGNAVLHTILASNTGYIRYAIISPSETTSP